MAAPRRFDHQEGRPQVKRAHPDRVAAGGTCAPPQGETRTQVANDPENLGGTHRASEPLDGQERQLGEGRIHGGHAGVVDEGVPACSQAGEFRGVRGEAIGVDSRVQDVAVPEVPPQVVGEPQFGGQRDHPKDQRRSPQYGNSHRSSVLCPASAQQVGDGRCGEPP